MIAIPVLSARKQARTRARMQARVCDVMKSHQRSRTKHIHAPPHLRQLQNTGAGEYSRHKVRRHEIECDHNAKELPAHTEHAFQTDAAQSSNCTEAKWDGGVGRNRQRPTTATEMKKKKKMMIMMHACALFFLVEASRASLLLCVMMKTLGPQLRVPQQYKEAWLTNQMLTMVLPIPPRDLANALATVVMHPKT